MSRRRRKYLEAQVSDSDMLHCSVSEHPCSSTSRYRHPPVDGWDLPSSIPSFLLSSLVCGDGASMGTSGPHQEDSAVLLEEGVLRKSLMATKNSRKDLDRVT